MSLGVTIGRAVDHGGEFRPATLDGYGRRWNYGSLRQRADWHGPFGAVDGGIVVSLGVERSEDEATNGAIVRVDADELARLDRRESDYDCVDVTERIRLPAIGDADEAVDRAIVTYVPRPSAVARYRQARGERRGAVRRGYVELVEGAFADLGGDELSRYRASTPEPDVPIVEFESVWLAD